MSNIAFIPARGGSKSIPLKNIKDFCGKPLIYWNLYELERSEMFDTIYVSTDDDDIRRVVTELNFPNVKLFDRDPENARDHSTTESTIMEFLDRTPLDDEDIFYLVQITSPFTRAEDYKKALVQYNEEDADSLLSCADFKRFIWSDDGRPLNYDYKNRPRRQDFQGGNLVENGAFYINTVKNLKKFQNRLHGKIEVYLMPEYTMFELDEEDDWMIGEYLMNKYILID